MIKKYLTFIRESKNYDQNIVDECNDILIDLKDDGYEIRVSSKVNTTTHSSRIATDNNAGTTRYIYYHSLNIIIIRKEIFTEKDISEYIGHVKSYLSDMPIFRECIKNLNAEMGVINPDRYFYFLFLNKKLDK